MNPTPALAVMVARGESAWVTALVTKRGYRRYYDDVRRARA